MHGFVERGCAALLAFSLLGATPPSVVAIIDGTPVPRLPAFNNEGTLMVAVAPLANRLRIPVRHRDGVLALQVDGTWVEIRPNDVTLRESGAPVVRLATFPTLHNGMLYVSIPDASAALDVDASVSGGRLVVVKKGAVVNATSDDFHVVETSVATPAPHQTPASRMPEASPKRLVGNLSAQVSDYAQQRNYNAILDGGGEHFHATFYINGTSRSRSNLGGTLRMGDVGAQHVSLGSVNDPLYGEVFNGGGSNGIEKMNRDGRFTSYTTTTMDARHVLAVGLRSGDVVRELALANRSGATQPLLGLQKWNESPHFVFDREVWSGWHGVGLGLRYRTTGRIYTDDRIAIAGAGLPLVTGDALTQTTIGYDLSTAFGVRIGFGASHALEPQKMLQLYGGSRYASFTLSHYGIQNGATLELARDVSRLRFGFIQAPGYSGFQSDGSFEERGGVVETRAYVASGDSTDFAADFRIKSAAPSASLGIESVHAQNGGRVAPTVGYVFPVGTSLSFGFEFHPLPNGNGIRLSASQSLYANPVVRRHFVNVGLASVPAMPVYLIVDGVRTQRLFEQTTRLSIDSGSKYLSVQSEDGKLGSTEQRVVDGAPDTLTFALWPVSEVHGTVHLTALPLGVEKPPLEGITVVLQPQGVTTQTDRDGNFTFPPQAIDPLSTVRLDPDTVPQGFAGPDPLPTHENDPVTVLLRPSTKIEKVIF